MSEEVEDVAGEEEYGLLNHNMLQKMDGWTDKWFPESTLIIIAAISLIGSKHLIFCSVTL